MIEIKVNIEYNGKELLIYQHGRVIDIKPQEEVVANMLKEAIDKIGETYREMIQANSIQLEGESAMKLFALIENNKEKRKKEMECPLCSALIDVTKCEKYDSVACHDCNALLEFIGTELIDGDDE